MQRPAHLMAQRQPQFSPRMIAAISGAVMLEAAVIYFVANSLASRGFLTSPQPLQVQVLAPPPKVHPVVLPEPQLVRPSTVAVPKPDFQIQTLPAPQVTPGKMTPRPVTPVPVHTADIPPKAQGITAPVSIGGSHGCTREYPAVAQRLNQQGTTTIRFTVNTDGSVANVQVANSSGFDSLDQAAIRCASSWRYKPAVKNGQAVSAPWTANVLWKLQNG